MIQATNSTDKKPKLTPVPGTSQRSTSGVMVGVIDSCWIPLLLVNSVIYRRKLKDLGYLKGLRFQHMRILCIGARIQAEFGSFSSKHIDFMHKSLGISQNEPNMGIRPALDGLESTNGVSYISSINGDLATSRAYHKTYFITASGFKLVKRMEELATEFTQHALSALRNEED